MGRFDEEYFYLQSTGDERFPSLTPDQDTVRKPFETEVLPFGQKLLMFYNGNLQSCLEKRQIPVDPPPDVLFAGDDLVVREHIAKKLNDMEIPNLAIQPAIYKDHKKKWHEDYGFLTFTKEFDCWDREKSERDSEPSSLDPTRYDVYVYMLDEDVLQKTPLRERLLFRMGGSLLTPVFAHKSIVELFRMPGVNVISVLERAKERGLFDDDEAE